jgi:tetratricopeptide (TPR) repeat protein
MTEASDTATDLDAGLAHHEAGRFAEAERLYRRFLDQEPDHPDALNLLGVMLQDTGDLAGSIAVLSRAVAADPEFPEAFANLARAQCAAGDSAAAKLSCERAIALDPDLPEAHLQLARSLLALQANQSAIAAATRAADLSPGSADAQLFLGHAQIRLKNYPAAVTAYRAADRLAPDRFETLLALAGALAESKQFDDAVACCRRAVAVQPQNVRGYVALGVALRGTGDVRASAEAAAQAIALDPTNAAAHLLLGSARLDLNDAAGAREALAVAIALAPGSAGAQHQFAMACMQLRDFSPAAGALRNAVRLRPDDTEYLAKLGRVLCELGEHTEAVPHLRRAIALAPEDRRIHLALVAALWGTYDVEATQAACTEALRLAPNAAEFWAYSGYCQAELGRFAEAAECNRTAIALNPEDPVAHNNLGNALRQLGRLAEAEMSCRDALRLRPDFFEAHNNLGSVLQNLGRVTEAEASYRAALRLRPDGPGTHTNLARVLLLTGRFEEGWDECEWRWKTRHMSGGERNFSPPLWQGETIGDRVILLHAEQGFGDTLQFCRYAPLVAAGARTVLEVQAPLVRLLARLPGITQIIARDDSLPAFDLHCPLMSLPRAFGTTLETIPGTTPYLTADPVCALTWRVRLAGLAGLRVGLVWAGGQLTDPDLAVVDGRRSLALDMLAPLAEVAGVNFVSLQKGGPAAQAATPAHGMALHDFTADLHDFADTAALIDGLDLVISVDTAVAHLAGGLGKPVWLLNRFDPCWRWLLNRDDSPWYPQLRQFRQPAPGDWTSVIGQVRDALTRLAAGDRDQLRPRSRMRQAADGVRG